MREELKSYYRRNVGTERTHLQMWQNSGTNQHADRNQRATPFKPHWSAGVSETSETVLAKHECRYRELHQHNVGKVGYRQHSDYYEHPPCRLNQPSQLPLPVFFFKYPVSNPPGTHTSFVLPNILRVKIV